MPLAIIAAAVSLYSGYKSSQAAKKGGRAAREAAYLNADDLRNLATKNAAAYRSMGAVNANAIRVVGEANAIAVENATSRNVQMYGMQAGEDRRRHIIRERQTAGQIRAMSAGSGIQTNTGSPLHYLNSVVDEGIRERRFGDIKAYWTIKNMFEEGTEKAAVIRLTADQQAMVVQHNADVQAQMAYDAAMAQADAMERSGDVQAQIGAAQGTAALWGGIAGAFQSYASFGGLQTTPSGGTTTGAYTYSGGAWSNTGWQRSGWSGYVDSMGTGVG